jgi:hypothetical protein
LQDPPKFTQIAIFGLKTNHLATLPTTAAAAKWIDYFLEIFFCGCFFTFFKCTQKPCIFTYEQPGCPRLGKTVVLQ